MRLSASALVLFLLVVSSAPAQSQSEPLDDVLAAAEREQAAADAEAKRLEAAASRARDEAGRLHAKQAAAAQQIESAEARLTAADARLRLLAAEGEALRQRLTAQQRPIASLLGGLVLMARQPPLLAIADPSSAEDLVRLKILLDASLPVIRARTAALSAEVRRGEELEDAANDARAQLIASRENLAGRRAAFVALEQKTLEAAAGAAGQAVAAGDIALASAENIEQIRGSRASEAIARALAAELAASTPAPLRPARAQGSSFRLPFEYRLPASSTVIDGLGSVSSSGIRSRGVTLGTPRGLALVAPASGVVQFVGPFRDYDGILIIDHGEGWLSLLTNVASPLKKGDRVKIGEPVGRAIGALGVELSQNGQRYSPALIAGSSRNLSKNGKGG